MKQLKTGVSWNHKRMKIHSLIVISFIKKETFLQSFHSILGNYSLDRDYYGLGTKYTKKYYRDNRNKTLVLGLDYLNQSDDRKRYKNDFGVQGEITFDQIEQFKSTGLYMLSQTNSIQVF